LGLLTSTLEGLEKCLRQYRARKMKIKIGTNTKKGMISSGKTFSVLSRPILKLERFNPYSLNKTSRMKKNRKIYFPFIAK
jgi:hypothetical protein